MSDHDCWKSEYDWEILLRSRKPRETVLCVLFDHGAQRHFSSVRITMLCSNDITPEYLREWNITPQSPSPSVVSRVSSVAQDTPVTHNAASLPICNIVFMADRHSARSQTASWVAKLCGELVFRECSSPEGSGNTVFEFDQPLTENTQSVSVSFTSSYRLYTMMTHGIFSHLSTDFSATVGRVVRVLPDTPTSKRRTIFLPIDVLLPIFENLRFPLNRRSWRKDILSSALVCREWTCALDMLLADFRSRDSQQGHPPEIASFANGLVARPNLGLGIKYLSVRYLERHPAWDPYPDCPPDRPSPMFLAKLRLQQSDLRRSRFGKTFLSILRVAENVQNLRLDPGKDLVTPPDDLADAIRGLSKLETFEGTSPLSMAQLMSCIATLPSLKHLTILSVVPSSNHTLPLASPSCCLTEIELLDVPIKDDELTYLVSTSGSTLERLMFNRISQLTNAGLAAALNAVCTSLTHLYIMNDALTMDRGEELALDAVITRMPRLMDLHIVPEFASEQMVERRAEAFSQRTTPALSEVHLHLMTVRGFRTGDVVEAMDRDWPGWKMDRE